MTDSPSPHGPLDWDLLDRFLAGQCDASERQSVLDALGADAGSRVAALRAALHGGAMDGPTRGAHRAHDVDALLAQFHARMTQSVVVQGRTPRLTRWRAPLAATIGAVMVIVAGTVIARRSSHDHDVTAIRDTAHYATTAGQQATVTLRDGSRVTLAPQSTLSVVRGYGVTGRRLILRGEAAFDVVPHRELPLTVTAGTIHTQVLGTQFDVRAYATDRDVRVAVVSGKVAVSSARTARPVVATAGTVVRATDSSVVTTASSANDAMMWTSGHLVFHDAPTLDVLSALTHWYGYQFRVTDSTLIHQNLTIRVSTQSLAAALATLKLALDAELTFDSTTVIVQPRRGSPASSRSTLDRRAPLTPSPIEVGR